MKIKKWRLGYTAAMIVAAGLIFLLDYSTPETSTYSLLYIGLVLLTIFHRSALFSLGVTIVVSVLTVMELFFNPPIDLQVVWTNESISLAGIWVAYLFAIKFKKNDRSENQHRERLDALFTYATEGMLIANASGEILIANPTCSSMLGYESGELVGKKIEALIPDRFAERHVRHREKYNKTPSPRSMGTGLQLSARRKDGTEIPVEISLSNFETGDGKFVIAFIIDITERRRNEELIRKEKEQAQRYLDIAPIIFLVLDTEGHVILINQTGCQTIGLPESSLLGKNWFELLNTQDSVFLLESYKKIFTGKPNPLLSTWESRLRTQTGDIRIVSWKNIILRDEKGTPYAVLTAGQDVTERNRQEEIIRNLNADLEQRVKSRTQELAETVTKLEQSNITLAVQIKEREAVEERLRASREELRQALSKEKELSELKSRFVTMASHEFRTPLSTILSSASLAGKYNTPEDEEKRIKHLDRIKSSVNNLTSILNDFLSLGKLEEGKIQCSPSEFDLLALSHDLVSEMKEMTKKGQVVSYRHEGRTSKVILDKNLTRNICINLLSNAIKYSDEGKPILFATSVTPDNVVLRVTDQGIGIPQEEQAHIFERFFRANNATNIQGTGLGLNIVKKYAELMNGIIRFESKPDEGTTFIVELPSNLPTEPNIK